MDTSMQALIWNKKGIELYQRGRYNDALILFEDAIKVHPDVAFLRVSISKLLMDQGRYSRAEYHLEQALQMSCDPFTQRDAFVNLAGIQYAQKHFTKAVACLEHAIEIGGELDHEIYLNLGMALENLGEWDKALDSYKVSNSLSSNPIAERGIKRLEQLIISTEEVKEVVKSYKGFVLNPPACHPRPLTVAESQKINSVISAKDPLIFLAGAGISYPKPAGLPLAGQILKEVFHFLYEVDKKDFKIATGYDTESDVYAQLCCELTAPDFPQLSVLPFFATFQILYDLYNSPILRLVDLLKGGVPNLHHVMLAYALHEGHTVITTNFDQMIERAYENMFGIPVQRVLISDRDFQDALNNGLHAGVLAKIHGDMDDYNSLALTLEGTAARADTTIYIGDDLEPARARQQLEKTYPKTALSIPKALFLQSILSKRKTIIMGYSGFDTFDIMPILNVQDLKCRGIWVEYQRKSIDDKSMSAQPKCPSEEWQSKGSDREVIQPEDENTDMPSSVSKFFLDRFGAAWMDDNASHSSDFQSEFCTWVERLRIRPGDGLYFAARLFSQRGMGKRAALFYDEAIKKYSQNQDHCEMRWLVTRSNYASVLGNLGESEQSKAIFEDVIAYLENTGKCKWYPQVYVNVLLNITNELIRTGEEGKATKSFEKAMKTARDIDDQRLILFGLRIAATLAYRREVYGEALAIYKRVLENAITVYGDLSEAYEASMGVGMSLAMLGKEYAAVEMFLYAEDYAKILADQNLVMAAQRQRQLILLKFTDTTSDSLHKELVENARKQLKNDSTIDTLFDYIGYHKDELFIQLSDRLMQECSNTDVQTLLLFLKSNVYYRMGDIQKSIDLLKEFSGLRPDYPLCEHNLGVDYYQLGEYREAEKHFLKAIESMHGEYPLARCNLGMMYADMGELENAREQLSIAEKINVPRFSLDVLRRRITTKEMRVPDQSIQ